MYEHTAAASQGGISCEAFSWMHAFVLRFVAISWVRTHYGSYECNETRKGCRRSSA